MKNNKHQLLIIFLTIFIDLLGFGLIIPIVPFYLEDFVANPLMIGKTIATMITVYSLMQFIFAPIWGRLSDRIGRRPVLLFSLAGTGITHFIFATADSLWLLFAARILTGIFAATVPTAMAYISDITSTENRAKGMGMVGAAFGLGFIIGPAMGGLLSHFGGYQVPLFAAGALSFFAFIFAYFKLPETVDKQRPVEGDYRRFNLINLVNAVRHPNIGLLFIIFFTVTMSFANLETIFALYTERIFRYDAVENGYIFAFIGVISATVQGVLIGPLAKRFGEKKLITAATLILGTAFILLPIPDQLPGFLLVVGMIALGIGLHNPSVIALISKNADQHEQGGILGLNQSFSSLGRVLGPLWAGFFFDAYGPAFPFITSGILILIAALLSLGLYNRDLLQSKDVVKKAKPETSG